MPKTIALAELSRTVGEEIGVSSWMTLDQARIDAFAAATDDHQFIHVDPERARAETPFGGTIAHGFLTLSMLSAMSFETLPAIAEQAFGINYGLDKVRFMAPVHSGERVRGRFHLKEVRRRGAEMVMMRYTVTVEIEGKPKPALVADWLTICQVDAKDMPENV